MSIGWVSVLVFLAVTLVVCAGISVLYDLVLRYRGAMSVRLDALSNGTTPGNNPSPLFKDLKEFKEASSLAHQSRKAQLREKIEQSGIKLSLQRFVELSFTSAIGLGIAIGCATWKWWGVPIGVGCGILLPYLYVEWVRLRRIRKLCLQLPEAFDVMSRAVKAGQTIPAAFQIVADDFQSPVSDEFRHCYEEQNLGMPYDVSMRNLARRTGSMELRILVVALIVQARSGGNLIDLLKNLSEMVRKRLNMQGRVKAITGEGRLQAYVLIVLPIIALVALLILAPEYASYLTESPWLLGSAFCGQFIGALWIRKIVNFEY